MLIFDEVMTGFRVAYGGAQALLRHHARPDGAGQDHRRRPAGGGLRGVGRDHGPRLAGRADLPGRHALGQSAGHGRRPGDAAAPPRRSALRAARGTLGPAGRGARPRRDRRRGPARRPARRQHADALLPRRPGARLRGRQAERHPRSSPASSGRCSPAASTCRAASSRPPSSRPRTPRPTSTTPSRPRASPSRPSAASRWMVTRTSPPGARSGLISGIPGWRGAFAALPG